MFASIYEMFIEYLEFKQIIVIVLMIKSKGKCYLPPGCLYFKKQHWRMQTIHLKGMIP